jgi:esterase/lipase
VAPKRGVTFEEARQLSQETKEMIKEMSCSNRDLTKDIAARQDHILEKISESIDKIGTATQTLNHNSDAMLTCINEMKADRKSFQEAKRDEKYMSLIKYLSTAIVGALMGALAILSQWKGI